MRGTRVKRLRAISRAHPEAETTYNVIKHHRTITIRGELFEVDKYQLILADCRRRLHQFTKKEYKLQKQGRESSIKAQLSH